METIRKCAWSLRERMKWLTSRKLWRKSSKDEEAGGGKSSSGSEDGMWEDSEHLFHYFKIVDNYYYQCVNLGKHSKVS